MARNELLNLAYKDQYDTMVFIDDDEYWDAAYLIEIIQSPKDVVCLPVVNKGDKKIGFNVLNDLSKLKQDSADGYYETTKVGTGFMKLSKKVVADLWESNTELSFRGKKLKNICEYGFQNGDFVGEDISLCTKILELGYKIWINPKHTVSHIGNKMYRGDFAKSLNEKN